jgi:tripartite-type tricarboxylate transporter receptor subunit TctC
MKKLLISIGLIFSIVAILAFSGPATAGEFPERPIDLIVAYGAGGSSSMGGRIIASKAGEVLGEPVVIVNKPGAGGTLAGRYAANAKPDGYTMFLFSSGSNGVSQAIRSNIGYKNSDFDLIAQFGTQNILIGVAADSPFKTLKDLIDYAKKHPGELKCANAGLGSSSNFGLELFKLQAGGLKIDSVPVRGGGKMAAQLLGGHVQLSTPHSADMKGLYDAGRMRALAVFSSKQDPDFPGVPTFEEQGVPGVWLMGWYGLAVPKGVPKEILAKLRKDFGKVASDPEIQKMLRKIGYTAIYRDHEEFGKFVKVMESMYAKVVKATGIKVE